MLEAILIVYLLGMVMFFISMLRDKYVEHTTRIITIYILASLVWPITGILYLMGQ